MSYVPNPISDTTLNSFTQFESQTAFSFAHSYDYDAVRDGGSLRPTFLRQLDTPPWLVIDNATDTPQFKIQGEAFMDQTPLENSSQTEFAFRNGLPEEDLFFSPPVATRRRPSGSRLH